MNIHDLAHRFLLERGYPRASIDTYPDELRIESQRASTHRPTFLVTDPKTAVPLAVIDVTRHEQGDGLEARIERNLAYAKVLDTDAVDVFVFNLADGGGGKVLMGLFQCAGENQKRKITAQQFPDLASLRLRQRLPSRAAAAAKSPSMHAGSGFFQRLRGHRNLHTWASLVGFMLLLVALVDGLISRFVGSPNLTVAQTVMLMLAILGFALALKLRPAESENAALNDGHAEHRATDSSAADQTA